MNFQKFTQAFRPRNSSLPFPSTPHSPDKGKKKGKRKKERSCLDSLSSSVQRACSPEHRRASQTCYCLNLPFTGSEQSLQEAEKNFGDPFPPSLPLEERREKKDHQRQPQSQSTEGKAEKPPATPTDKMKARTTSPTPPKVELMLMELIQQVKISFVNGINQTNHSTNQERPCTTTQQIKKELSICQSFYCLDLVSFPVLSQIKPQAPLLVCPSVNSFKFQPCDHTPPETQTLNDFSQRCWESQILLKKILFYRGKKSKRV
eukprot:TRINITY_DN705_c0_g1_i2.p1 TRINITY_DN705_c0_g1~~TRINITY_DN705_c0_g1_i2.p1  ORF type:complete len:261 (+),score=-8.34 TRINITY_DN705_c0_g1_i2:276-1058(+)